MNRRLDVVALVSGVLACAVALGSLWTLVVGPLSWSVIRIAAPLLLVVVGVAGLALSRNRD